MSPDVIAFDLDSAPDDRDTFLRWYQEIARKVGPIDRACMTPELTKFYDMLRGTFPPMSGPDAVPVDAPRGLIDRLLGRRPSIDPTCVADYGFSGAAVHVRFARSMARTAHGTALIAAREAGVGLFDARTQGGAILRNALEMDDMLMLLAA